MNFFFRISKPSVQQKKKSPLKNTIMNVNTNFSVIKIIIKNDSKPSSSINFKKKNPQHKNFKIFSLIKKIFAAKKYHQFGQPSKNQNVEKKKWKKFFPPDYFNYYSIDDALLFVCALWYEKKKQKREKVIYM